MGLSNEIAVPTGPFSSEVFLYCIHEKGVSMGRCAFRCTIKDLQIVLDAVGFTELSEENIPQCDFVRYVIHASNHRLEIVKESGEIVPNQRNLQQIFYAIGASDFFVSLEVLMKHPQNLSPPNGSIGCGLCFLVVQHLPLNLSLLNLAKGSQQLCIKCDKLTGFVKRLHRSPFLINLLDPGKRFIWSITRRADDFSD